jgi:hypothetical protein
VGLLAKDIVTSAVDAGVATGSAPAQAVEQAFRRLRSYEVSFVAHPEYLGEVFGAPIEQPIEAEQIQDDSVRLQFDYVGQAVSKDLGLPSPRLRLAPDPSMPIGWMTVQLHDQRGWAARGLRPGNLLVLEPARRAGQRGLETRAMQNPYTGEEGAEVPAAAGPSLDEADVPYWSAGAFAAIVTHLALRRRVETLIGPAEVEILLAELALDHPDLVELAMQRFTITEVTAVLRALVREGIPIRDMRTILEQAVREDIGTVVETDGAPVPDDGTAGILHVISRIRRGLRAAISAQYSGPHHRLLALRASAEFERRVAELELTEATPQAREQLLDELWEAVEQASRAGAYPLLITTDAARWPVRRLVDTEMPELPVIGESEFRGDTEVVSLPWKEETMAVEHLVIQDRVARLLAESAGPSLRTDSPGSFSFSRGSAAMTVELARREGTHTVITVSARPATELPALPATFERFATQGPEPGVQVLLEPHGGTLRPVCSLVLLGDFLDPEELEFALAAVTAAADRVQLLDVDPT